MMDLAKLKVVDLRAELSQRGLDTKGNKPVLVERLRKALEEESGDPKTAADASAQNTNEENARERTPEPMPPKTPGRSSRSSAASTPSKAASHRGHPKILLAPLTEKQITPTKSPPVEKQEKTTPEKREKALPVNQEKTSPEKLEKSSPQKQQKASAEKQEESSPEKVKKTTPEKQEKPSPEKQEKPSPEKQEKSSLEKQEKSSPEKQEKTSPKKDEKTSPKKEEKLSPVKNLAPSEEAKVDETPEEETQEEEAPKHLEAANEAAKTDTGVVEAEEAEKDEETSSSVIQKETEPESEEPVEETEKPALEDKENVGEDEEEEENTAEAAEGLSESASAEIRDAVEEKNAEEAEKEIAEEEAETAEEEPEAPEIEDEDKLLEDEAMETNESNEDNKASIESMEIQSQAAEDREIADTAEDNTEESTSEDTQEEKPKVELKQEEDEEPNVENALSQNEEQDVDMKDVKEEPQEDLEQDSKDRDRKDRRDRKRKRSSSPQEDRHKSPQPSYKDDEPELKESEVVLSWYDSDLNLVINRESFLSATAMHNDGFGYIWAGARASFGFVEGKVYYEVKITECCDVNLPDEVAPHVLRVGWSVQGTNMQLGEEPLTYGYGGTGKISTGNRFSDYGVAFGKDDVIGCYLDLTCESNVVISYTVNGKEMGAAFTVSKSVLEGKALFPHVLTKNCTFECNFGQDQPWSEEILNDYLPVGAVDLKDRIPGPRRPERREECEMIMMCGLPAAGKTVWATKYAQDNPDKMYNVLGTNALIEKMKVIGLPRKRNYPGRWEVLINKCTRCLNKLLDVAATRRRNYILDQTNVYPSAQRRKMRSFYGYKRRAVVIVPTEEEFKNRTIKRTACEGEVAPESAVLEMKANFGAPVVGESFDVIEWVELQAEEAKKLIEKYNKEGRDAGFGQQQASKRPRFERSDNRPSERESRDSRQSSRDSRDSRDHRERRNNYPDRSRNSTWRGGSNSGSSGGGSGWRDRQQRPAGGGHVRHGAGGSGGYGGPSGGGWRGRGSVGGPQSSYRPVNDRRVAVHDRRTSGSDRNRSTPSRQGGWGPMNSYQSSQHSSGWGGSQSGNWPSSQSQQQSSWGGQQAWSQSQHQQQQQQQQWGNWKGYGQSAYGQQSSYSQQGYGNGNWGSWNQQYYNQYWGQQQPTGQTSAAGSQAVNATGSTTTGNSTTSTGSTYSSYSPAWQGYAQSQSYSFSPESSNTNAQQQK